MPKTTRRASLALLAALTACSARQSVPTSDAAPSPVPQAQASARPAPVSPSLRLPSQVRPTGYTVELTLDPSQPTFQGVVDIDLEVKEATDAIWLLGRYLTVKEATLTVGGKAVALTQTKGNGDFLGFIPASTLPPGAAHLRLAYEGQLSERETIGAFRAQDHGAWYAYTQFEPLGARRVFPCFDEPGFKVPWQLTFHVPAGNVAVTNTPLVNEEPRAQGGTTYRFARTQPLPSYLIAFGVGPFDFLEAKPSGEKAVRTRIITPKGQAVEGTYAAQVTPEILGHLEKYFGIAYPFEKLDVLSVPLLGGAMEHPGLVTFNSELILSKPAEDSIGRQRRFYDVQMHELAHQWFGDLVTMAWWDDLWLNEAFASWATPRIVEGAQPTWDAPIERVRERSYALGSDSLVTARHIRQPIESEDDILNAFDGITYGKGSAVLSMTESWLGRDVFQRGVQRHLRAHAHGNATAKDFLDTMSAESGKDVSGVLGSFLDQGGAPLVTARLDCSGKVPVAKLSQSRFLPVGSAGSAKQTWKVPLCVRYGTGRESFRACTVMEGETAELPLSESKACPAWLLPNADGAGYYRTALDAQMLGRLLSSGGVPLTRAERVTLVGDVQALVSAGTMAASDALGLLPGLAGDKDRQVFQASLELLGLVRPSMLSDARQADRERFLRDTYGARARALGFTPRANEDEDTRLLRPMLLRFAGEQGGDAKLVAEARKLTDKWLGDSKAIAPELVYTTLGIAAAHGDAALHAKLMTAMRSEKDRRKREQLIDALGGFRDPALVRENLKLLLEPGMDTRELVMLLFMAGQVKTRDVAFGFVKENYDALASRLEEDRIAALVWSAAAYCDPVHRQEAAAFFTERMARAPGGPRMLAQMLEGMDLCIAFKEAQGPGIESFLASPKKKVPAPSGR
ncbi:M1 family metallopeptidase [Vitiosangium sp. GDMCC 1.1324]|uniref:M1 family metallopeptidase n=1 Tax=Vitiosangium sp. (strain GDMCC 1.1324) TaxID=2138576 RepID=UPI000D3998B4|nr:M1 family metallopeptidase [Vitiosangium sp. GDMCC 1.1324]PTL83428.1 peptidase M1 [Vitiosangium sp. GDMCC 1.1324]